MWRWFLLQNNWNAKSLQLEIGWSQRMVVALRVVGQWRDVLGDKFGVAVLFSSRRSGIWHLRMALWFCLLFHFTGTTLGRFRGGNSVVGAPPGPDE